MLFRSSKLRLVAFSIGNQVFAEPDRRPDQQDQNAGRAWIQRSNMTNPTDSRSAPNDLYDVMRSHSRRLIDDQNAGNRIFIFLTLFVQFYVLSRAVLTGAGSSEYNRLNFRA